MNTNIYIRRCKFTTKTEISLNTQLEERIGSCIKVKTVWILMDFQHHNFYQFISIKLTVSSILNTNFKEETVFVMLIV